MKTENISVFVLAIAIVQVVTNFHQQKSLHDYFLLMLVYFCPESR